jgi:hypothetical protein
VEPPTVEFRVEPPTELSPTSVESTEYSSEIPEVPESFFLILMCRLEDALVEELNVRFVLLASGGSWQFGLIGILAAQAASSSVAITDFFFCAIAISSI